MAYFGHWPEPQMLHGRAKEGRSRMKATIPRHRANRRQLLAAIGAVGAASAGIVVARRLRSGAREQSVTSRAASPLIGHEFSFVGHTFKVLESAREAQDGSLRYDYSAPPGANVSEHTHTFQEESFELVSGRLGLRVGGQELVLSPGQSAIGPPRVPHAWWNPNDEERVHFQGGIRPGIEVETMFETVLGLMEQGKTIGPFPKNPLQTAVLAREIASWVVLGPVVKALLAPLFAIASVGRFLGYSARYPGTRSREEAAEPAGQTAW
jgi:mannose-6-phosphate isomerase-like protein (cupin superfamily)